MKAPKVIAASSLLLSAGLLVWTAGAVAQQQQQQRQQQRPNADQTASAHQLSAADDKAIRDVLKEQETAWNRHDVKAFMKSFRDDAEGVNIVGMYWRGKAAIAEHLTYYHATNFKDLEETVQEVSVHPIGEGYAVAVSVWKVGSFTAPNGAVIPACRHRDTSVMAKGADGWRVVHFHNTVIDEAAVAGETARPTK